MEEKARTAQFHLPGLFEFHDFYREFLPIYRDNKEFFYDNVTIASIYGAPRGCLWGGGRMGMGENKAKEVLNLLSEHNISGRLTFSNSLLTTEHLSDRKCNRLCEEFEKGGNTKNGVIVHSDLLLDYLKVRYPGLYFVSSTTKVLTAFDDFRREVKRDEFEYVVPDFRINKRFEELRCLSQEEKDKVELLCNECCFTGCTERKACYENVSRKILGEECPDHVCKALESESGYMFSKAMNNPSFISTQDINNTYLPMGFSNFKIEGRNLGSALLLEFILYYMIKPEYQINVREKLYLDSMLNLF